MMTADSSLPSTTGDNSDKRATMAQPPFAKDLAASAMILGFASVAWFGWGSGMSPMWAAIPMGVLAVVGIVVGIVAAGTRRQASGPTKHQGAGLRSWWIWLIVEIVLIFAGNLTLGLLGHYEYQIAWTHLVMGLHFIPLARTYQMPPLTLTGVVCSVIALVGALAQLTGIAPAGLIVGGLGGLTMLASAVAMVVQARDQA